MIDHTAEPHYHIAVSLNYTAAPLYHNAVSLNYTAAPLSHNAVSLNYTAAPLYHNAVECDHHSTANNLLLFHGMFVITNECSLRVFATSLLRISN